MPPLADPPGLRYRLALKLISVSTATPPELTWTLPPLLTTVADAVLVLSRKTPDWKLSAEDYRIALLKAPRFAQVIKLCDRFDNILSLYTCPDAAKVGRYLDQTEYYYGDLGRAAHGQLLQVILAEIERIREGCVERG